jgi:hypothetical protein
MGVGMGIAARWMPVLERGGFSPIPFFYVVGGSLVFVFLTWRIPSVAGSMMAGAVSPSLADDLGKPGGWRWCPCRRCGGRRSSIGRAVGYRQPGSRVRPQLHRHVGRRAGSGPGKA